MNKLIEPPQSSGFITILQAWKLLLIAFLVGGLLGSAVYALFPPPYRTQTVIVINQNLEKVFPTSPDKEIFYFLERETNRLEELAWSDVVLQRVVNEVEDISIQKLREETLQMSQPSDGGWRLYAIAATPERAKKLANSWANAFEKEVRKGIKNANELAFAEEELDTLINNCSGTDDEAIAALKAEITTLQNESLGIHPQAEVFRSQESGLIAERTSSLGLYALSGALIGLVAMILFGSVYFKSEHV